MPIIFCLFLTLFFTNCSKESGSTATETEVTIELSSPKLAYRLSPEQISSRIKQIFEVRLGYSDSNNVFHDTILEDYGVLLGGVDFETASTRDPSIKAQTLLMTRALAWELANNIIYDEYNRSPEERKVFTTVDLETDRPYDSTIDDSKSETKKTEIRSGETRWTNQAQDLFKAIYGRNPESDELSLITESFKTTFREEAWAPHGWRFLLFSLLSTIEFWHI